MLLLWLPYIFFNALCVSCVDIVSPCPEVLIYDERNDSDSDIWYARVVIRTDAELSGVWLILEFDRSFIQLGNWFGEVVTQNATRYLIRNSKHILKEDTPETVRFFVKYDAKEVVPKVTRIFLNGRTICRNGRGTIEHKIVTVYPNSNLSSTTPSVFPPGTFAVTGSGFNAVSEMNSEEDEYFQGDFAILNKTQNPFVLPKICGTVIKQPKPLITHGEQTNEGEFPWHAALYHARGIDLTYVCGASLISRKHLLTVAHCVTKRKTSETLTPGSLLIYLGKHYLKLWSNPGIQAKHVDKVIVHENYNPHIFVNDLAIIKLITEVEITNYVRPVCLWEGNTALQEITEKTGIVAGWGFDETGRLTNELTKARMPIVSQETCIYSFPDFFSRFTSERTFCAGFSNGTSVCNGDSGGGLVLPRHDSNPLNPTWRIRGLVSISVALQNQFRCDSSHYVVFTDVAKYTNWIKDIIK